MITTQKIDSINHEELQEWANKVLAPYYPEGTSIHLIDGDGDGRGESQFYSLIDIDVIPKEIMTIPNLVKREVKEHTRGNRVHFYAYHVVKAAVVAGELVGNYFFLHYHW